MGKKEFRDIEIILQEIPFGDALMGPKKFLQIGEMNGPIADRQRGFILIGRNDIDFGIGSTAPMDHTGRRRSRQSVNGLLLYALAPTMAPFTPCHAALLRLCLHRPAPSAALHAFASPLTSI